MHAAICFAALMFSTPAIMGIMIAGVAIQKKFRKWRVPDEDPQVPE